MKPWKTKSRQTVLSQRPWLVVENHTVELPHGRLIPNWPWIITPDYVNVVAVTEDKRFICFRQVKYGVDGTTLGIVGGFVEEGEEPMIAARRELLEETGYESTDWTPLGSYRVDPNRGIAMGHFYLVRQARYVTPPNADDLEEQEILLLTRLEVETALAREEFKVLAWAACLALALRQL
ncbi:MAG TPA: NUDIX hydrolase [Anaerolineales bacterium]|nr:NUDIX hydrolase [Anaerolineales bacterium]